MGLRLLFSWSLHISQYTYFQNYFAPSAPFLHYCCNLTRRQTFAACSTNHEKVIRYSLVDSIRRLSVMSGKQQVFELYILSESELVDIMCLILLLGHRDEEYKWIWECFDT